MTHDQEYYQQLIDELEAFTQRLREWEEQCENYTYEGACLKVAVNKANDCMINLNKARAAHAENEKDMLEGLLERIRTGTTTISDVTLGKRFFL